MLLNLIRRLGDREGGVAMIAVIGLIGILVTISTLVLVSVTQARGVALRTSSTGQAQASAESGIAVARAAIASEACQTNLKSAAAPYYVVTIQREVSPETWQVGCPTASQRVKITSTGAATAEALNAPRGTNTVRIEAVLSAAALAGATAPVVEGPLGAIYSIGVAGGSAGLVARAGETATVAIATGDYRCDGGATIGAPGRVNILVANGDLTLGGSCKISGDVWVPNGKVTLPWSTGIEGNIYAAKSLSVDGGAIGGSVWVSGAATLTAGTIGGNLKAQSLTMESWNTVAIAGSVVVGGDVRVGGSDKRISGNVSAANLVLATWGCELKANAWVTGATTFGDGDCRIVGTLTTRSATGASGRVGRLDVRTTVPASPYATLPDPEPTPALVAWSDYDYDPSDWSGYQTVVRSGSSSVCNNLQAAINQLGGAKGVIDARGCTGGISVGGDTQVTVANDLAIVAPTFTLDGSAAIRASKAVNLWLVVPDTKNDGQPTCSPSRSAPSLGGGAQIDPKITVMIYSPCAPNIAVNMTGQIFAATAGLTGSTKLTLSGIALPGLDLASGSSGGAGGTAPGFGGTPTESAGRDVIVQRRLSVD